MHTCQRFQAAGDPLVIALPGNALMVTGMQCHGPFFQREGFFHRRLSSSERGSADLEQAATNIGYGAVKYADLQNHPQTNYKFSYDKMLSTQGNTAVYLLFAHARLVSIVRKAAAKGVDPKSTQALDLCAHAKERALAFELTQFAGVVASVAEEFLPVRVCDYLYKVSTKFTEFVTECKVLDDPRMKERVVLCEATGVVMRACFDLLGIEYLMQI